MTASTATVKDIRTIRAQLEAIARHLHQNGLVAMAVEVRQVREQLGQFIPPPKPKP